MTKEKSQIKERILQFIETQSIKKEDFCKKVSMTTSNLRGDLLFSDPNARIIAKIIQNYPNISPQWLLLGKGDMLFSSGEHQEPAAVPHEPVGEKSAGKSGDKSSMIVADEPQGYYPTSPTEQVLRQLISALERTIKDKEEIISLLKERQPK